VIDSGRRTKHKDLVAKINEIMSNEAELKKLMVKLKAENLNKDYIDSGPIASIQSGGQFKHKLFAETDDNELRSDCIILGLGSLYRGYNSYIARTLLIDPTEYQKSIYKKIDTLYKVVTQNLRVGVKLGDIYKKAKMFA
jgi:nucleosome binding factor SPN SPT16 subunit